MGTLMIIHDLKYWMNFCVYSLSFVLFFSENMKELVKKNNEIIKVSYNFQEADL